MRGRLARYLTRGPLIASHALGTSPRWGEEVATADGGRVNLPKNTKHN